MPIPLSLKAAVIVTLLGPAAAEGIAEPIAAPMFSSAPVRLSDEAREAAIEAGALRAVDELPINGLDRRVHGEIGMEIGSGGSRALFGTAMIPLGESGSAQMSFMTGRNGWRR